ncbi:MAG: hypothetical protein HDT38_00735 [Clostridiales bacterium]|nr:hypothetical protein [Clostridiales bacterium]
MLDDLLELALEIGGEVLEAVAENMWEKKKKPKRKQRPKTEEPWERQEKKPPWEA